MSTDAALPRNQHEHNLMKHTGLKMESMFQALMPAGIVHCLLRAYFEQREWRGQEVEGERGWKEPRWLQEEYRALEGPLLRWMLGPRSEGPQHRLQLLGAMIK